MQDQRGRGYAALDGYLAEEYGDCRHVWFTPEMPHQAATAGLFAGARAYLRQQPRLHWHYVTFGLSDLGEKSSSDPRRSGFGFELTIRVPVQPGEPLPPRWPFLLLAELTAYVFRRRVPFEVGHHFEARETAAFACLAFARDPLLQPFMTPNGRVDFLQVVGLHADELEVARRWKLSELLALLGEVDPLLLTDPERPSMMHNPELVRQIHTGILRDGSGITGACGSQVAWDQHDESVEIILDDAVAHALRHAVPHTLRRGQPFVCVGPQARKPVVFARASSSTWRVGRKRKDTEPLMVNLSDADLNRLESGLTPHATIELPATGVKVRVVP